MTNACFILNIGCAAHLIHNSALHLIDDDGLKDILRPFTELIKEYTDDKKVRHDLDKLNKKVVARNTETRWSSHLHSFRRLLELRASVDQLPLRRSDRGTTADRWDALEELCSVLSVWETANLLVQRDSAHLGDCYQAVSSVLTKLTSLSETTTATTLRSPLLVNKQAVWQRGIEYLTSRYMNSDLHKTVSATAYLAGYRTGQLECNVNTVHYFLSYIAPHVLRNVQAPVDQSTPSTLIQQLGQMELGEGAWKVTPDEIGNNNTQLLSNAKLYYKRRVSFTQCQPLASLALTMLSVNPSEASVERTFSALKGQWTALRNRLSVETINSLLQLQLNHSKLRGESELSRHDQPAASLTLFDALPAAAEENEEDENKADDGQGDIR